MNPDETIATSRHIEKCDFCQNMTACFMELAKLHMEKQGI